MTKLILQTILAFTALPLATNLYSADPIAGEQALYYVAGHFATGYWANKPNTGSLLCPVLTESSDTKIAVYVKQADSKTMYLAVALENIIEEYPQLKKSFLIVSEEPRDTSMSNEEFKYKMDAFQAMAAELGIINLSLGYLKFDTTPTRWRNKLDFFDSGDIVLCVLVPEVVKPAQQVAAAKRLPLREIKPFYHYVAVLNSKDLNEKTAKSELMKAVASLSE